jgi:hypothetical protein
MKMTAAKVSGTAKTSRDGSHFRRCAAGLLLTLCATLAVAGENAAEHKEEASATPAATTVLPRTENIVSAETAVKPASADKARVANAGKAAPTPRRPDTAGWRRIMAGAGRT